MTPEEIPLHQLAAVTALQAAHARGRAWLAAHQQPDGSVPYTVGGQGRPEPTLLAAAVGWTDNHARWLAQADLGWTAFLLPAVAWSHDPGLCRAALDAIDSWESEPVEGVEGFDATLPGWSWVAGTAPWVEPTAFALMSLRRAQHQPQLQARAVTLILDRQCEDGGWNYGNPEVYGAKLAGHLDATGWAVMALPAGTAGVDAGLAFLEGALARPSTMNLALAALAHQAHGHDPTPFLQPLAARVTDTGVRNRLDLTALAVAALGSHLDQHHVFV